MGSLVVFKESCHASPFPPLILRYARLCDWLACTVHHTMVLSLPRCRAHATAVSQVRGNRRCAVRDFKTRHLPPGHCAVANCIGTLLSSPGSCTTLAYSGYIRDIVFYSHIHEK